MVAHPAAAAASIPASVCPLDLEGLMRRANTPRHCTQPSPRSSSLTSLPSLRLPPSLTFTAKIHLASLLLVPRPLARPPAARPPDASRLPCARPSSVFSVLLRITERGKVARVDAREGGDRRGGKAVRAKPSVTASARALLINDCRRRVARPSLRPSLRPSVSQSPSRSCVLPMSPLCAHRLQRRANVFSPAAAAALLLPLESSDSDPSPGSQSTTHARPLYPSLRPRHTRSLHRR